MPEENEIDLEEGKIFIDEKWYNVNDLKSLIKKKIASDDFDVGTYSNALTNLKKEIDSYKAISLKVPKNLLEAYSKLAADGGYKVENCLRGALEDYIESKGLSFRSKVFKNSS